MKRVTAGQYYMKISVDGAKFVPYAMMDGPSLRADQDYAQGNYFEVISRDAHAICSHLNNLLTLIKNLPQPSETGWRKPEPNMHLPDLPLTIQTPAGISLYMADELNLIDWKEVIAFRLADL